jgi:RimJ/RimL family protein N-acetyltransferase
MRSTDRSFIFRSVKKDDVNDLYTLLNELPAAERKFFHPHPFDRQTITEICSSAQDHYFVMVHHEKIIGYSFLRLFGYPTPSFGCCIRGEYQGKGYGPVLTQWTINKAKELGYHRVILKVYKENVAALKIYKTMGFTIIGDTEDNKQYKMEIQFP